MDRIRQTWVAAGVSGLAVGATLIAQVVRRSRSSPAARLSESDTQFHSAYARLRAAAAEQTPVLVLLGDSLHLLDRDLQREWKMRVPAEQILKMVAHMPLGIFACLHDRSVDGDALDSATRERLQALQDAQSQAQGALAGLLPEHRPDAEHVLTTCVAFITRVLGRGSSSAVELGQFSAELGPVLLRMVDDATQLELDSLDSAVESALQCLTPQRREHLEVIVAGNHQARARSIGIQYFLKRFDEAPGDEKRVVYAESINELSQARELVGTRKLDRVIARAFFGDETRLQRDVLGD
ncbi:MAG: hypothetical protein ABW321_30445, partial [Polyangiales bacterium]